ncbi:MAG: DUF366 family protein [bacterium]|nr:DUF366 family protein [bacterium]
MKSFYIDKPHEFRDLDLKSGWVKRLVDCKDDCIVSFQGRYYSKVLEMEHVKNATLPFEFEQLLHFVVEHKGVSWVDIEIRKRLFLSLMADRLGEGFSRVGGKVSYFGENLNISHTRATKRSGTFHVGVFLYNEEMPVPTTSLDQFDVPVKDFALSVMHDYQNEINAIQTQLRRFL